MNVLFTICGRAGSKGFKNKNLKSMQEIPLVYYSLAAIYLFKRAHPDYNVITVLNTDSDELCNLVKKQELIPDIVYLPRKELLSGDRVAKVEVIKDIFLTMKKQMNFDIIIDLDITSPIRRKQDIENVMQVLLSDTTLDLVFSVVEARRSPYFNMVEKKESGYYNKICQSSYTARQEAPESFELNASIYAYCPIFLDSDITQTILEYRCGISTMPDYLVLDIDSEEDFRMMEILYSYYMKKDRGLSEIYMIARQMASGHSKKEVF